MYSIVYALKAFQESALCKDNHSILVECLRHHWTFIIKVLASPQRVRDDEDSDVERTVRILKVIMRTLEY
jgi:hypothetical protein